MNEAELRRFMRFIEPNVGPLDCWLWRGSLRNGYGQFRFQGTVHYAHRVFFHHLMGYWSDELDHFLCGDERCVRHVENVTHRINMLRSTKTPAGIHARSTCCPRGHSYDEVDYRGRRGCRRCRLRTKREYYRRNRDKILAQQREYQDRKRTSK